MSNRRNGNSNVMEVSSNRHIEKMNGMIAAGPLTIILVYSPTCPHCHTYMPLWKELCNTKGRTANMVSMKADTYEKTPLADQKTIDSVPTVLLVDQDGSIKEVEEPRDMAAMKSLATAPTPANLQAIRLTPVGPTARPSVLPAIPALPVPSMPRQYGGNIFMNAWKAMTSSASDVSNNPVGSDDMIEPESESDNIVQIPNLPEIVPRENLAVPVSQSGGAGTPWSAFVSAMRRSRRRHRKTTRRQQKKRTRKSRRQRRA